MKLDIPKGLAAQLKTYFGEVSPVAILAAVDYSCRRKAALAKDQRRHKAGKLARHIYAPRLPENAPRRLASVVAQLRETGERLAEKNGKKP